MGLVTGSGAVLETMETEPGCSARYQYLLDPCCIGTCAAFNIGRFLIYLISSKAPQEQSTGEPK